MSKEIGGLQPEILSEDTISYYSETKLYFSVWLVAIFGIFSWCWTTTTSPSGGGYFCSSSAINQLDKEWRYVHVVGCLFALCQLSCSCNLISVTSESTSLFKPLLLHAASVCGKFCSTIFLWLESLVYASFCLDIICNLPYPNFNIYQLINRIWIFSVHCR